MKATQQGLACHNLRKLTYTCEQESSSGMVLHCGGIGDRHACMRLEERCNSLLLVNLMLLVAMLGQVECLVRECAPYFENF